MMSCVVMIYHKEYKLLVRLQLAPVIIAIPFFVEIERLQAKKHKINGHYISVKLEVLSMSKSSDVLGLSGHELTPPNTEECVVPDLIEVTGLPPIADESLIRSYFESTRSGGKKGTVLECKLINPGVARLKLRDPEGM